MDIKLDWKFYLSLAAAVVVPIGMYQWDLDSKEFRVDVLSVTALFPSIDSSLELKISQGSDELKSPVLSILEVANSGGKPIVSSEFESPLQIAAAAGHIRRVSVVDAVPDSLKPMVEIINGAVQVKPLLLNPGDKFKLSVLTDGAMPQFAASARIAGIKEVRTEMSAPKKQSLFSAWVHLIGAMFTFSAYVYLILRIGFPKTITPTQELMAGLMGLGCAVSASVSGRAALDVLGYEASWQNLGMVFAVLLPLGFVMTWPMRRMYKLPGASTSVASS